MNKITWRQIQAARPELVKADKTGQLNDQYCDPRFGGCGLFGHSASFCPTGAGGKPGKDGYFRRMDRARADGTRVSAPLAAVQQVRPDSFNADALFDALGKWESDDDATGCSAVLKQLYCKAATERAAGRAPWGEDDG